MARDRAPEEDGLVAVSRREHMAPEVGRRISELRNLKRLSSEDLASALFVSRQTVSTWENGKALPDTIYLLAISKELGVTVDELLGRCGEPGDIVIDTPDGAVIRLSVKVLGGSGDPRVWEATAKKLLAPLFSMPYERAIALEGISFSFTPPAAGDGDNQRALPLTTVPEGPIAEAIRGLQTQLDDLREELKTRREPGAAVPKRAQRPPRSA